MKATIPVALFFSLALTACGSTSNEVVNKDDNAETSDVMSERALAELAKNYKFSEKELRAAAKKLGYRCSMEKTTGSRLKKKTCTTKEQRDILAKAKDLNRQHMMTNTDGMPVVTGR